MEYVDFHNIKKKFGVENENLKSTSEDPASRYSSYLIRNYCRLTTGVQIYRRSVLLSSYLIFNFKLDVRSQLHFEVVVASYTYTLWSVRHTANGARSRFYDFWTTFYPLQSFWKLDILYKMIRRFFWWKYYFVIQNRSSHSQEKIIFRFLSNSHNSLKNYFSKESLGKYMVFLHQCELTVKISTRSEGSYHIHTHLAMVFQTEAIKKKEICCILFEIYIKTTHFFKRSSFSIWMCWSLSIEDLRLETSK